MIVQGKVQILEDGSGIRDLVIAAYDISRLSGGNVARPPILVRPPSEGGDLRGAVRLGSVGTGTDGAFRIEIPVEPGSEPRRLAILVLAPERAGDDDRVPELLHTSFLPPSAAAIETVVVKVPRQRLEAVGAHPDRVERTHAMIERDWQHTDRLNTALRAPIKTRAENRKKIVEGGTKFTANLTSVGRKFRSTQLFTTPDRVEAAAATARAIGLAKMGEYAVRPEARALLNAEADDLARRLGVDVPALLAGVPITGSVCAILDEATEGTQLERVRSLLDAARPSTTNGSNGGGSGGTPPQPPEPLETSLPRRIAEIIADSSGQDALESLKTSLNDLRLSAGPADNVAYHDFHSLQIAFPHVWVEAFDETLREQTEALYADVVQLHADYDFDPGWIEDLEDLEDVHEFLREIGRRRGYFFVYSVSDGVAAVWPEITFSQWNQMSLYQHGQLNNLAEEIQSGELSEEERAAKLEEGRRIVARPEGPLGRVDKMIMELRERLSKPHAFHYFAPNTVNYGIMLTYRQRWEPEAYQVGDLVGTIPLAPGERRRYRATEVVHRSRTRRELESSLAVSREESRDTRRSQAEIVRRATFATNFQQTVEGALTFGIGEIGASTTFGMNQATESARTKRSFREAVNSAAQEYRNDHSIELELVEETDRSHESEQEVSNPNDEVAVTYLLYELERRYHVTQTLQRLTPVILVAQDVPAPRDIDDDWLLTHEWIIRRVLLDDSFREALDLLRDGFAGDEVGVAIKAGQWETQKGLVERLGSNLERILSARDRIEQEIVDAMLAEASAEPDEVGIGDAVAAAFSGGWSLLASIDQGSTEKLEKLREALKTALDQVEGRAAEQRKKLQAEAHSLETATRQYVAALEKQLNRRTLIDQLLVHVKENILHYMHAVWLYEPPDQRFFRLYHREVPVVGAVPGSCTVRRARPDEEDSARVFLRDGELFVVECPPPHPDHVAERPLVEIADLDRPLGFKGNYIIFPLKECTYITDFMMQEYVDDYFGIRDPDVLHEFPTQELVDYLRERGPTMEPADRAALERLLSRRLTRTGEDAETIIVPSGQLYMEVLRSEHAVLEKFKALHRALDVSKVWSEVRASELENLRYAARLAAGEREDPQVDRRIVVEGAEVLVNTDT